MPIYEYECKSCCLRFELNRQFGQNSEASCPRCQSEARRIFSPVPILFKETRFYVTDKAAEREKRLHNRRNGDRPESVDRSAEPSQKAKDNLKVLPDNTNSHMLQNLADYVIRRQV